MNEEIARILQLLESGKINADEAERLIKAVNGSPGGRPRPGAEPDDGGSTEAAGPEICLNPFRDLEQLFRTITRAYRGGMRRHRRFEEWRWHEYRRSRGDERRQRAETQSVADRVRYVVAERALLDPDSGLEDLDEVARGLLRYELEDEFSIEIPADDLATVYNLDALSAYVESRLRPSPPKPAAPVPPVAPEPPGRPRSPRGRKPRSKDDIPAG